MASLRGAVFVFGRHEAFWNLEANVAHVETTNTDRPAPHASYETRRSMSRRSLHGSRRSGSHNILTVRVPMAVAEKVRADAIANFRTVSGQLQALLNERYGSRDAEQRGAAAIAGGR